MQDFRRLRVWAESHALVLATFRATQSLARRGHASLGNQLRRAAMSVPANIAEGCGRRGRKEFARFLEIALASATEVEYHLLLARDLGLIEARAHEGLEARTVRIKRMLTVLLRRLREAKVERSPVPSTDDR